MHHSLQFFDGFGIIRFRLIIFQRQVPDAFQPAADAADAGIEPFAALFPRPNEHHIGTHGIGAQFVDVGIRIDHIPLRFTHFLMVCYDNALVEELFKGLAEID